MKRRREAGSERKGETQLATLSVLKLEALNVAGRVPIALTSDANAPARIIDEPEQFDFELTSTNLPEDQEKQLHGAFAEE